MWVSPSAFSIGGNGHNHHFNDQFLPRTEETSTPEGDSEFWPSPVEKRKHIF